MLQFILNLISECTPNDTFVASEIPMADVTESGSWSDRLIDVFTRRQKTKIVIAKNKLSLLSDIINGNVIHNEYITNITFDLPKFIDAFYTTIISEIADDTDMFIDILISIIKRPCDHYDLFTSMHNLYPMTDADNIRLLNAAVTVENMRILGYLMPIACVTKQGHLNVFDFGQSDSIRDMFREYISGINYLTPEATVLFNEQFHTVSESVSESDSDSESESESDSEIETRKESQQKILLARVEYMEKLIASLTAAESRIIV